MMRVKVHLTIDRIENVNLEEGHSLMVEVGWVERETKFRFPGNRIARNCTLVQSVRDGGNMVQWNEEFQHSVKLRRIDQGRYKSWFINLEVHETVGDSKTKIAIAQKAMIDIAEGIEFGTEKIIRIPLDCQIRGNPITATLEVKLKIINNWSENRRSLSLPKSMRFRIFSCIISQRHRHVSSNARPSVKMNGYMGHELSLHRRSRSFDGSSSEDEPEPSYKNLKLCNYLINQFDPKEEDTDSIDGSPVFSPNVEIASSSSFDRRQTQNQSPLQRIISLTRLISFRKNDKPKGKPLLAKSCSDIGGDDIDVERHEQSRISHPPRSQVQDSGFAKDEPFVVGRWERRSFCSRGSEAQLLTDAFLATIDQTSERASGGSACTVLAVVIADWLYKNPGQLPLQCEMDQLVCEGSVLWRNLCRDENLIARFSDLHFDLDTVLKEGIGQLRELVDLSHLGFFIPDEPQESMVFLKDLPSFDSIWDKMILNDLGLTERMYICSWNDHFFVLKIERDVIYLIDTFGGRLFEGCNQAYILKFDKYSVIYSSFEEMIIGESECISELNEGTKEKDKHNKQVNGESKLEIKNETGGENINKQENGESKFEMDKEAKEEENNNKQENGENKLEIIHKQPKKEENNKKQENGKIKLKMHMEHKEEENNNKHENGESELESNEEENNNKHGNGKIKLEPIEKGNNKDESGESNLKMHKESKHEENNNKQANGFCIEKEVNNNQDEHAKIQEDDVQSTSVDEKIKIEQEKVNHSVTNGAICENIKCPQVEIEEIEEIERDQGNGHCSNLREANGERVESPIVCKGLESCREYIKGFLVSLPLRQLQEDLKRGSVQEETLRRRLQIEFHYVVRA